MFVRNIISLGGAALMILIAITAVNLLHHQVGRVAFVDVTLEASLRDTLQPRNGKLTYAHLKKLEVLDATGHNIKRLDGLQHALNLRILILEDNYVKDVLPLAKLKKLEVLSLRNNEIVSLQDIHFEKLASLPSLHTLSLRHNVRRPNPDQGSHQYRLKDINILSDFRNLEVLELRDNHIEDISPLSALVRLRILDISQNPLKGGFIQPLRPLAKLEELNLRETGVTDLRPLQQKDRLTYLNLHSNVSIQTLQPIGHLINLETLILRHVPVKEEVVHLRNLTQLRQLNLRDTGLQDLTTLGELIASGALQNNSTTGILAELDLRDNPLNTTGGRDDYAPVRPFWQNIAIRYPEALPLDGEVMER